MRRVSCRQKQEKPPRANKPTWHSSLARFCFQPTSLLALTLSERASSYCAAFICSRFTLRAALGVSFLRKRRRIRSSFARISCLALIPSLALTLSERASSYCVALELLRFTIRAALGVSALRARRREHSSFARLSCLAHINARFNALGES